MMNALPSDQANRLWNQAHKQLASYYRQNMANKLNTVDSAKRPTLESLIDLCDQLATLDEDRPHTDTQSKVNMVRFSLITMDELDDPDMDDEYIRRLHRDTERHITTGFDPYESTRGKAYDVSSYGDRYMVRSSKDK